MSIRAADRSSIPEHIAQCPSCLNSVEIVLTGDWDDLEEPSDCPFCEATITPCVNISFTVVGMSLD